MSILGRLVEGCLLGQHQLCHQPKFLILIYVWERFFLHNLISWSHELIRQEAYHACWSRTTRYIRPILWMPHLLPLDPCLFQRLISQALNSSLLASPQARWAPLSFLPDIFMLLLFMINPLLISISFSWVITNFIYFYALTVTRMYPSNSFMDGSAIDSILPILSVLVTALRTIVQRGELQTLIPAMPEERTSPMRTLLLSCMFF
jgi:Zn-dependent protease with chaperone function